MVDLPFIKSRLGLIPSGTEANTWFMRLKSGAEVNVTVTVPRNLKFHRKFFAMLHVSFDAHDWPEIETESGPVKCSFEMFRAYVTIKSGHYEMDVTPEGKLRPRAKSIAFAKMSEAEFNKVYSDVLNVILLRFLPGWDDDTMNEAVNNFLGGFG